MTPRDATPAPASSPAGGVSVVPGSTALQLPRVPRRRTDARQLRVVERGTWIAAVEYAIQELEESADAKSRGVNVLVRKLANECKRRGRPWVDLSRRQIAELLGFKGGRYPAGSPESAASEEAVRKLLRRAELAGELLTFREQGHKFRSGVPSHKVVIVRLLWRLDALPRPLRLAALADEHVRIAGEALRRAVAAEEARAIARQGDGAPTPEIVAPAGTGCATGTPSAPAQPPPSEGGPQLPGFSLSDRFCTSPSFPPSAATAAASPLEGAEGQDPRPPAAVTAPAPDGIEPVGPATGPEAREAGADDRPGAVLRGRDGKVFLDLGRLREVRDRLETLRAELEDELRRAEAGATAPLPFAGRWRSPDDEARDRGELVRRRELEREIERCTRFIADARVAARVGWKLHKAAERRADVFTSPQEMQDRNAAAAAALAEHARELADAPRAWGQLWPELVRLVAGEQEGALYRREDLAALRCVADTGDALVLRAVDRFHANRVRDRGLAELVGHLAAERLGRDLQVEVLE